MNKCFIFGALDISEKKIEISDGDYIIAVDAGLKTVKKLGLTPNLIIGDFDSLGQKPSGDNVIVHPVMKDDTDTLLAVKTAFKKGFTNFRIYGCIGGRLDHTVASIQTASFVAQNGGNAVFSDGTTFLTVIQNAKISFNSSNNGVISAFAVGGKASGVTENNLLYRLENAVLSPEIPIGVSNEFIGKESYIQVKDGKLCIIWNGFDGGYYLDSTI